MSKKGFTLIELIVGITILAILITTLSVSINPIFQIQRGSDSKRVADIDQLAKALDFYYQDQNCYPQESALTGLLDDAPNPGGSTWSSNNMVYLRKIPYDPNGSSYKYVTSSGACPQWGVIFAKLSTTPRATNMCSLSSLTNCTPEGYDENTSCIVRGSPGTSGCAEIENANIE